MVNPVDQLHLLCDHSNMINTGCTHETLSV